MMLLTGLCQLIFAVEASAETYREALHRGNQLSNAGDDDGAVAAYVLAKSLAPDAFNDASIMLARLYSKLGRYAEADAEYKAILAKTSSSSLREEYGKFLVDQGKFSEASSYWSSMLSENPNNQLALYYMGICSESEENLDQARDYFSKAISISSGTSTGQSAANKLARLEKQGKNQSLAKSFPIDPETGPLGFGWWNLKKMPIHVYIDDGTDVPAYRPEMRSFVTSAMDAWRHVSGGKFSFVLDPPDSRSETAWKTSLGKYTDPMLRFSLKKPLPADPITAGIHVHWTDSLGGVVLGLAWPNTLGNVNARRNEARSKDKGTTSGEEDDDESAADAQQEKQQIAEFEIRQVHVWLLTNSLADGSKLPTNITAANSSLIDKQNRMLAEVAIHEFGHALGLPHSNNPHDIMCSGIFALDSRDLVEARSLSKGDEGSLREHYNNYQSDPLQENSEQSSSSAEHKGKNARISIKLQALRNDKIENQEPSSKTSPQNTQANASSELSEIIFEINARQYSSAVQKLNLILKKQKNNWQALYLRAVANVMLHNYSDAVLDYEAVIRSSPDPVLGKRASEGLKKIKPN